MKNAKGEETELVSENMHMMKESVKEKRKKNAHEWVP